MIVDRLLASGQQPKLPAGTPIHRAVVALLAAGLQPAESVAAAGRDARLATVERLARLTPDDPLLRETLATLYLSRGADQRALETAGSGAPQQDGILDFCRALALFRLGRKGEALAELSRAATQAPALAYRLARAAPGREAGRPISPEVAAASSPEDLLRLLLRGEPELHLWLQALAAKISPRSRRKEPAARGDLRRRVRHAPRQRRAGRPRRRPRAPGMGCCA